MQELECRVTLTDNDFIMRNHRVHDVSVLPGVTFLDLIFRLLIASNVDHRHAVVRNVVFAEAIVTTAGFDREIRCRVSAPADGTQLITAESRWSTSGKPVSAWRDNFTAQLVQDGGPPPPDVDLADLAARATDRGDMAELYARARAEDIEHGAPMRCTGPLLRGPSDHPFLLAELSLEDPAADQGGRFHLHPAKLDASTLAGFGLTEVSGQDPFIPMFIREFRAPEPLAGTCFVHVPRPEVLAGSGDMITNDYALYDEQGRYLAGFIGLSCKRIRFPGQIARLLADVEPAGSQAAPAATPVPDAPPTADAPTTTTADVTARLASTIAAMLDRPTGSVACDVGFYDLGLDSVAILELGRQLESMVGESLYPTLLFEYSTVDKLAEYLVGNHTIAPGLPTPTPAEPVPAPSDEAVRTSALTDRWEASDGPVRPADDLVVIGPTDVVALLPDHLDGAFVPVRTGSEFAASDDGFRLDPTRREHLDRLFDELESAGRAAGDLALVVTADADVTEACLMVWTAATALLDRRSAGSRRMTVVCSSGREAPAGVDAVRVPPVVAGLAAFARTITAETPQVHCRVAHAATDSAGPADAATAALLAAAVADGSPEAELRYRDGRRMVRRWVPVALPAVSTPLREQGCYLVTGGSGGLGIQLTDHLVRTQRARVMLVGIRPTSPELGDRIAAWNAAGGDVRHVAADITRPGEADRAAGAARAAFGRIDGVVHCAGVSRDGVYFRKQPADLVAVMAPKTLGTLHLDRATATDELDFFVVYSSLAASVANPGQCDYAAGNAFAEAFVCDRAGRTDRAGRSVAIGWPFWADGGMRLPDATVEDVRRAGRLPLPTAEGLRVLEHAIAGEHPLLVVLHGRPEVVDLMLPGLSGNEPARTEPARTGPSAPAPDDDGIAVIGIAGRYPQAADLKAFWRNLLAGQDCITEVPEDRWNHADIYDPAKDRKGHTYGKWGGFLDGVDLFDAKFFGISRREAERMDPQERLFLTTCWHALEDAGYPPQTLGEQAVGVFAGVMWNHYQLVEGADDGVAPTAMHASIANRVSYTFDLTGPSMAVDTACSSSSTAIYLAVQSLRRGESGLALAGGVNASLHPQKYLQLSQGNWLSTDGRCRAFGRDGSGYVPGEGVGAVVLKPLSHARRDGDSVYGVIRAATINHGGRTGGVTVPNPASQAALISAALREAGWDPDTVGYLEAHGTGTALGDPIEVEGARRAFGGPRPDGSTCGIGSVKSNVGHLEGAAGVVGVTKVLLQLKHATIVPSLHAEETNPKIDFSATPFVMPQEPVYWPRPDSALPRRAGVSAFGAGGTNVHLLIEQYENGPSSVGAGPWLFPLSAADDDTLRVYARTIADHLRQLPATADPTDRPDSGLATRIAALLGVPVDSIEPDTRLGELGLEPADLAAFVGELGSVRLSMDQTVEQLAARFPARPEPDHGLADMAYTLQVGRTAMSSRMAVVADHVEQLASALQRFADGSEPREQEFWGPDAGDGREPPSAQECCDRLVGGRLAELAADWVACVDIPWSACHPDAATRPRRVSLPGYPFREEPYWIGRWSSAGSDPTTRTAATSDVAVPSDRAAQDPPAPRTPPRRTEAPAAPGGPELEMSVIDGGVALLTMRSPTFTDGLLRELPAAFAGIAADDSIRAVVLTGSNGIFSMGGTPHALASLARGEGQFSDVPFLYEGLLRCGLPVVCAVAGHASGGGLAFALFADIVVMSADSDYRANFVNYGFTPGIGATYVLERRFGSALAAEMMLTGRTVSGEELARRGANVTVVPGPNVVPTAVKLARSAADKPADAVRTLKAELARRVLDQLPEIIARELDMHERVLGEDAEQRVAEHFGKIDGDHREQDAPAGAVDVPAPEATAPEATAPGATASGVRAADPQIVVPCPPPDAEPAGVDPTEVRSGVEDIVGEVLYLEQSEIDPALSLAEMGLDSVGAVEVVGRLNRRFDVDLDSVAVYDHPTVPALTDVVVAQLNRAIAPAPVAADAPGGAEPRVEPELDRPRATADGRTAGPVQAPRTVAGAVALRSLTGIGRASQPAATRPAATRPADTRPADTSPAATTPADDIAVIGMSGRFPDAPDLTAFWANLAGGRRSVSEVPPHRWDVSRHFDPDQGAADRTYSRWAALLSDVDKFDERFFRLSPLDAEAMDPQQRLFLQEAWRALDDAGYAIDDSGPRRWGVFVGCGAGDYADLLAAGGLAGTSQSFLGNAPSMLAARIAYLLNLTGPTIALDTACSSSLVAVHLACGSIRRGECEAAVAGGVAVMCTPKMQIWTSQVGMLSPTGHCAPFDDGADGIVLGEGVGAVVLKRLDRALADGDEIHGVIRSSGVNGDGRTNGITAPSADSQATLIRRVYEQAGISPDGIGYVETHGTGTPLGDPIEVKALTQVFSPAVPAERSCGLGSVKGNIGHTTMAAGIASLLKVLLALRHRQLPPTASFRTPNAKLDLDGGPFFVVDELMQWSPGPDGRRTAAVSSFGFSGTNCHLVVSEAPERTPAAAATAPVVVPLSGRTTDDLNHRISDLVDHLDRGPTHLPDLAYTLTAGRAHHAVRAAVVAGDVDELRNALLSLRAEPASPTEHLDRPVADGGELIDAVRAAGTEPADARAALGRLGAAYVAGVDPDWTALYAGSGARRVSLPTYPFAGRRHWAPAPRGEDPPAEDRDPLLGRTPEGTDPATADEVVFVRDLTPHDPTVDDHRVGGTPVLPAAASLRILAAAALECGLDTPLRLSGVRWSQPIAVTTDTALRVVASREPDAIALMLAEDDRPSVRCRATTTGMSDAPAVDLADVGSRCPRSRSVDDLYADFARAGVEYRGDFRVLEDVRFGDDEALCTLRPLPPGPGAERGPALHPAVLDGAMQAAAVLLDSGGRPLLPFALDRFDLYDPGVTPRYSHVHRDGNGRVTIQIADEAGRVGVRLDGVVLRPAPEPGLDGGDDPASPIYVPEWTDAPEPAVATRGDRVAVVGDPADLLVQALLSGHDSVQAMALPLADTGTLATDASQRFGMVYLIVDADPAEPDVPTLTLFRLVKCLIAAGFGDTPTSLAVVTRGAVAMDGELVRPALAGVIGLVRAVAAEHPRWRVGCVDVGTEDVDPVRIAARLRTEDLAQPLVALRGDRRLVRRLVPADPSLLRPPVPRRGGTYLVVGGSGGIGVALSRHLAATAGARLGWVGRRPQDERIDAELAEIARLGGEAMYVSADAADPEQMRRAVGEITGRLGPLDGAVHAALVLRDRTLREMDEDDLAAVLRPKVGGCIALADAVRGEQLQFLAFFSSALSFVDAPGQANYAAASTFEDAYAQSLRHDGVPAFVVNWGFWGDVGAVSAPEFHDRFAALGIRPLGSDEGIAAFEQVLSSGLPQALVVRGDSAGLARFGIAPVATGAPSTDLRRSVEGYRALDECARGLLSTRLPGTSPWPGPGERIGSAELAERLGIGTQRRRLFDATLDMLARAGAVRLADGDVEVVEPPDIDRDPVELAATHHELAAHVRLLRRCVDALPEVLAGTRTGTDVLFPGGSTDLVEEVYRGNAGSDFHHGELAEEVAEHARRVAQQERRPARLLEIGAGTGASTGFVLSACAAGAQPPHLTYTDISPAFVAQGEQEFGPSGPTRSFRTFDVEIDPAEQGFGAGEFDVVYATNVLHATADIAVALRNAVGLLRPGGVLLVNEVTRASDFLTVTFGLTPGWWRFADGTRRLPHAPLLGPDQWQAVLADAGLVVENVRGIPGVEADELEQCVLVARRLERVEQAKPDPERDHDLRRRSRDYVRCAFTDVLKFSGDELDGTATFDVYGVDSLVSLKIIERFERDLGELPSTLLFEHMTIDALAEHLVEAHGTGLAAAVGLPVDAEPDVAEPEAAEHDLAAPAPAPQPVRAVARPDAAPAAEDIAVVGVTGRYPQSPDLETFWRNLAGGVNCVSEVPADRWDWREHFDDRPGQSQRSYSRWAGFIDGVDQFDPGFFGILPRDAAAIDPQERLFLETAWTLLQDAGYLAAQTREPSTGVFAGTMYGSYGRMAAAGGWPSGRYGDGHSAYWSIANRVSYVLDLHGPSFAVDSACSSSLTAVHLACESLRRGECRMAIAGGVNLILDPAHLIVLCSMNMLAADGACKVFDAKADGFVAGEGVGAVLLKPLSAAVADGDRIWAVIKGGHINAGGRTSGYTVPNPNAQADLIVQALHRSGVDPGSISYVEAHGTGTSLGDPIEMASLTRALRKAGGSDRCAVGSVKANIGHLEGAAGIAGLTKVLLQMRHSELAPCSGLEEINPKIELTDSPLYLPTELMPWPDAHPRRAGISSFGAGGANVHLIVEEYPEQDRPAAEAGTEQLVLLSARTGDQLRRLAALLADMAAGRREDLALADLAYTTQVGRAELPERVAVLAHSADELSARLREVAAEGAAPGAVFGTAAGQQDLFDDDDGSAFVDGLLKRRSLAKLGRLWVGGTSIDWRRLWPALPPRRVDLPPYPFDRRRFWLPEPDPSLPRGAAGRSTIRRALDDGLAGQHRISGESWTSAAALLEIAHSAAVEGLDGPARLRDVAWVAPLRRDRGDVHVELAPSDDGVGFRVRSGPGEPVVAHGDAVDPGEITLDAVPLAEVRERCTRSCDVAGVYADLRTGGLEHGPALKVLDELWVGDGEYLARLSLPADTAPRRMHPALVDGAMQALSRLGDGATRLPVRVADVTTVAPLPGRCWAYGRTDGATRFDIRLTDDSGEILLALDGLEVVRPSAGRRASPHIRFLRPRWQPQPASGTLEVPETVLVLAGHPVGDALVERLTAAGGRCVLVTAGEGFARSADGSYTADLADREVVNRVVDDLARQDAVPDAMALWIPAPTAGPDPTAELQVGPHPLFWAATALLAARGPAGLRAVVGFGRTEGAARPVQAALPAALRSIALEHSHFAAASVEFHREDGPDPRAVAEQLTDELLRLDTGAAPEDRVREVRDAQEKRTVRLLEPFVPDEARETPTTAQPGGVYLITGGAGRIGRHCARHLAQQAPATVVLAGRSALDDDDLARLSALGGGGSRVVYHQADVSRLDDVRGLVNRIRQAYGPLTGVVHAAGVTRDGLAVRKSPAQLAEVLAPKLFGAVHLDEATADEQLEFLVLFSSVAAHTGNLGQADYAYANRFLDEFAAVREERRVAGKRSGRTVSIGWPLWAEGGMAVADATRTLFAHRWASAPLPTEDGLRAFDRALTAGVSCVVVDSRPAEASSVEDQSEPSPEAEPPAVGPADPDLRSVVDVELRKLGAGFLLVPEEHVDLTADMMDTGFDSISLTELVNQVNAVYGLDLLPTVLFECVNLAAFAQYLVDHHAPAVAAHTAARAEPTSAPAEPRPAPPAEPPPAEPPPAEPPPAEPPPAEPPPAEPPPAELRPAELRPAELPPEQVAVAVVGMAGTLPGSVDLDQFWRHLTAGDDLVGPPPEDRHELIDDPDTTDVQAGFLAEVRMFDAGLFRTSAREAALMDPQQRLFLQTVWRAFEDAGYAPSSFARTSTGVFAGVSACDYDDLLRDHGVPVEAHTASGVANCILANRVSHLLDLRGPSEAIDTACSSSLVALHHAVRAIQSGECDAAVAGGVNLLLSPGLFTAFAKSGMLSADGRCKTFDETADGYGRGEGVGAVLLKPLRQARSDGDTIYGVIRGSAVNHGGRGTSLTAPNPSAQAQVIVEAHRRAGTDPATVSYVETHGTGTRLGDPIEVEGLKKAFAELTGSADHAEPWVTLGSVKSNIGHLESASGMAGLLKVLLCARHRQLPPTIHVERPSQYLRLGGSPFSLGTTLRPWEGLPGPDGTRVHRAGISSFGFGGTNAHVVVEAVDEPAEESPTPPGPSVMVLSAPSAEALVHYAELLADHLEAGSPDALARVAYTLQVGRESLPHRMAFVAADRDEAIRTLRAAAGGETVAGLHRGVLAAGQPDADRAGLTASGDLDAGAAWVAGHVINWADRWPAGFRRLPGLPSFPFARTTFWFDERPDRPRAEVTMNDRPSPTSTPPPERPASRASVTLAPARTIPARPEPARPEPAQRRPERDRPAPAAPAAATSVAAEIRTRLASVLGVADDQVADEAPFADLGLDSIFRMELVRQLNTSFGRELTAADLYEHQTVQSLAAFVEAESGSRTPADQDGADQDGADQDGADQDGADQDGAGVSAPLTALIRGVVERPFDPEQSFGDNGFTSFDMLRTISALERRLGPMPKTLLFDRPTLPELADDLSERYGEEAGARLRNGHRPEAGKASVPEPDAEPGAVVGGDPAADGGGELLIKRSLSDRPELVSVVDELGRTYGKEGGLAGRDIAPMMFLGRARNGYFHVSVRDGVLLGWSYVGSEADFPSLAGELVGYARRAGLRPNFLSLLPLDTAGDESLTASPFGAVQRLEDLAAFSLKGGRMSRLRYMVARFERAGDVRVEECRSGDDPGVDRAVADMLDRWTENKEMVNPYITVVREEVRAGSLDERHRMFLTYLDEKLANVIILTRIPSEPGYLLDLEFYPREAPLGGLEHAIVHSIDKLRGEGDTMFSFGASFGVKACDSDNAAPEIERGMEELRSAGVFGNGNFQFKNKFRPTNIPIYLCQPASADRTPLSEIILMIASPELGEEDSDAAPVTAAPAAGDRAPDVPPTTAPDDGPDSPAELLARHGYNPLAIAHDRVPTDLVTDSWAELDGEVIRHRTAELMTLATGPDGAAAPDWLPFPDILTTGSGRSAESLLCRCWPGPRGVVLHNGLFPTWTASLIEAGFRPTACGREAATGGVDLDRAAELLGAPDANVSFVCVELTDNASGGRPVPIANLRRIRQLADEHGVPLVLDATRVVENAALVAGEGSPAALWATVRELLATAHTVTLSLPKDFGVTAGGLLATSDRTLGSAARTQIASTGTDLSMLGRKLVAAALADTEGVAALVRERMSAVRALWQPLRDAGLPVLDPPGGHCVLLDTAQVPSLAGHQEPVMAGLAWIFGEAGVRGAPHLADSPEGAGSIRFAVPLGLGVTSAAETGARIAALFDGPAAPPDLVAASAATSPPAAVYHPAHQVPEDVADALREGSAPADENEAVLRESCPAVERRLLSVDGGTVEVFVAGCGPTLLLMPPFNIGAGLFERQFAGLSDRFQVVAAHHPGLGASDGADITLDGIAELARAALDELDVQWPVHVAGASFGGLSALSFALRHPDLTASLTLIGSSYKIGNRIGEINRLEVVAREDFDNVVAGSGSTRLEAARGDLELRLLRCESMDPRTGLRYLDVFATRPDLLSRLAEIGTRTLIIQGRYDTVIPVKTAHRMHGTIPEADYLELPDAGHFPTLTNPDEVNDAMARFLAALPEPGDER